MMTVLRNLIGNAWKFTARKTTANVHGAGFDMTQARRLFKAFTRLHRQDEFPRQGMGLAIAHRIVKRHGGEIEASSEPGKGTVVRFWLPRAPD